MYQALEAIPGIDYRLDAAQRRSMVQSGYELTVLPNRHSDHSGDNQVEIFVDVASK